LNVDFDGPSLDFLRSRKPAHEGIKKWYPRKSRYFTVVGQSSVKTVADHGHAACLGTNRIHGKKCMISWQNFKNVSKFTERVSEIHGPHRRYFEVLC